MLMKTHYVIKIYHILVVFNIFAIASCSVVKNKIHTSAFTKPNKDMLSMLSTDSPLALLKRLKNSIKLLEKKKDSKHTSAKSSNRYVRHKDADIFGIMATPTNIRRVYLRSKSGYYLQMNVRGDLNGTREVSKNVIFIMESMSRGVIRLKGEASGKYICMNRSQRIVIRVKPAPKCLLRQFMEENNYVLFWSKIFSTEIDGQDGWFLALRQNGKIKSPNKTKVGDKSTMFHIHHLYNTT